jgi:hypothetical protein
MTVRHFRVEQSETAEPYAACTQAASHVPPSTMKELQQQLPSCSERAAVYAAPGMLPSLAKSDGRPRRRDELERLDGDRCPGDR